jgi:hypothetical protein
MRRKARLFALSLLLLAGTAPWPFVGGAAPTPVLGLPAWALYSLLATAVYALSLALMLQYGWSTSERDPEGDGEPRG